MANYRKFYVVKVDGKIRIPLANDGRFYYGGRDLVGVKYFSTKKAGYEWIDRNSYPGMSWSYELMEEGYQYNGKE